MRRQGDDGCDAKHQTIESQLHPTDVNVKANSLTVTTSNAFGIAVSTGAALGASIAVTLLTPTITASVGAGSTVASSAGNVTIQALHNYTPDSSPNPVGLADRVYAKAISGSGALLAAFSGGFAVVNDSPKVNAYAGPATNDPNVAGPLANTTLSASGSRRRMKAGAK